MDPEQLSNFKNIPYIPPSSPPPIDTIPKEVDYDMSDSEGSYDITGLSQKFCLNEENDLKASHLVEEEFLEEKIYSSDPDAMYLDKDNCYSSEDYLKSTYVNTEDCRHLSAMSPPPLNNNETTNESEPDLEIQDDCDKDAISSESSNIYNFGDTEVTSSIERKLSDTSITSSTETKLNNTEITSSTETKLNNIEISSSTETKLNDSDLNSDLGSENLDFDCLKTNEKSNQEKLVIKISEEEKFNDVTSLVDSSYLENNESEKGSSCIKNDNDSEVSLAYKNYQSEPCVVTNSESSNENLDVQTTEFQSASSNVNLENNERTELQMCNAISEKGEGNKESYQFIKPSENMSNLLYMGSMDNNLSVDLVQKIDNLNMDVGDSVDKDCNININAEKASLSEPNDESDDEFGNFSSVAFNPPQHGDDVDAFKVLSDDEFGDFAFNRDKECKPIETDDGDDFGQFEGADIHSSNNQRETDEDCDDFGDFSVYKEESRTIDYPEFQTVSDEDVFGEFNSIESSKSLQLEFSDDDDDDCVAKLSKLSKEALKETSIDDNKFQHLILRWTPTIVSSKLERNEDGNMKKLSDVVESDAFMWCHLADIDSSQALQLSWPNSHVNKLFLTSLNVDARNILFGHKPNWSSTIPLFAQTLSFSPLTPVKPSSVSNNWSIDSKSSNLDNIQTPALAEKVNSTPLTTSPKKVKDPEIKVIPPAQFDWSSSGLTNPLDAPGIEKEILNPTDDDKRLRSKPQISQSPLLEKILKESEQGPKGKQPNTNITSLPSEVKEVVENLPDLNFMRSKVLMFPILEGT